jgi:hypothetical protein
MPRSAMRSSLVTGVSGARRKVTSHAADAQMRAPDGLFAFVRKVAHLQCLTGLERAKFNLRGVVAGLQT